MEILLTPQFTWGNLIATGITLGLFFLALKTLERLLQRAVLPSGLLLSLRGALRWLLLFFEPTVLLLLLVIFVYIRPVLHGPVVGLLLIGGFSHLRNYLSGHIVRLYENVSLGNRLRTLGTEGVVTFMGRLGLQLSTGEGVRYASYGRLLAEGYTLVTGEEAGGFFQLGILPKETEAKDEGQPKKTAKNNWDEHLLDLLASAPYLSPGHRPDISPCLDMDGHFNAKLLVDKEHHLYDLIALLDEQGWQANVANGNKN